MPRARTLLAVLACAAASACDDPGAFIELAGARASRDPAGRVVVDVNLVAREGLGGNVGTYCLRVTFPGEDVPAEECRSDLRDGDTRTARFVSASPKVAPAASIGIWLWWAEAQEMRRDVVAP